MTEIKKSTKKLSEAIKNIVERSLPFEKTLCTVKIYPPAEETITTRENHVTETKIINMVDSRDRFKIMTEKNFNI